MVISLFFRIFAKNIVYSMIIVFIIVFLLVIVSLILAEKEERDAEKEIELARINNIKNYVTEPFSDIEADSDRFGHDYAKSLIDYANKMDKLSSSKVKKDLKPYDTYYIKRLSKSASVSSALGRIVIDKDLTPRFMANALNPNDRDIQLSVALTSSEVRELADKCNKIAMDKDIDIYRKDKVNKAING